MRFRFRFRRHADMDARLAEATARAESARQEARKSTIRQEAVREHVVKPMREADARNSFAQIIRDGLTEGGRDGR